MDLPDDLALPLERGAPYWYWLGGRPALDFANTLRERWWRRVETLVTDEDLAQWFVAAELLDIAPPIPPGLLRRAVDLREAIDSGVVATLAGEPLPEPAREAIDAELAHTARGERLVRVDGGGVELRAAPVDDPAAFALGLVARDAGHMLTAPESARIRVCASDTCSARFFDRSPAGVRRWCSPRECGNVEKARRHRRRQREQETA